MHAHTMSRLPHHSEGSAVVQSAELPSLSGLSGCSGVAAVRMQPPPTPPTHTPNQHTHRLAFDAALLVPLRQQVLPLVSLLAAAT